MTRGPWLLTAVLAMPAQAHFVLEAPPSAWAQNPIGDPQKRPPCGNEAGTAPTNAITTVEAGSTLTVRIRETIFHPGHYRVALGLTGTADLPDPAPVTPGATPCGSTTIQAPPIFPVLEDGALRHTTAPSGSQSFSVTIPANVACTRCTLQVIQFMSDHALNVPGGCYYSHCATLRIVPRDAGVPPPADGGGDAGLAGDAGTPPADAGTAGPTDGGDHSGHSPDPAMTPGCGCAGGGTVVPILLGALLLRRRRRQYR